MRRELLGLILLTAGCTEPEPLLDPSAGTPNVVILALDTFRADHVGVLGSSLARTPELDRFAAESIVFSDCASTATWTLPSFASLFTGKLPGDHQAIGGEWSKLPDSEITLAERLAANGFDTTGIVAVDFLGPPFGLHRGFDRYEKHTGVPVNGRLRRYDLRVHEVFRVPPREPWMLFVHYFDAHDPYEPPDEFDRLYYDGDETVEPEDPARSIDVIYSDQNLIRQDPRERYLWLEGVRDLEYPVRQYAGGVTYVDHHLGNAIEKMRERGVLDESIVIVLADHGEHLTEHQTYFTHRLPYAECLQVPLMVRLPGAKLGGTRIDTPVSLVDVLPTLLDLLGLDPATDQAGRSLVPLLRGGDPGPRVLFAEHGTREDLWAKSVWDDRWRYTEIRDGDRFTKELFDRRADPKEERDVAAGHPEVVARFAAALDARFGVERRSLRGEADPTRTPEIDPEMRERLKALGYTGLGGR
jgi:arylsulfatase A-like enzyme